MADSLLLFQLFPQPLHMDFESNGKMGLKGPLSSCGSSFNEKQNSVVSMETKMQTKAADWQN